jgi:hypothetical protein
MIEIKRKNPEDKVEGNAELYIDGELISYPQVNVHIYSDGEAFHLFSRDATVFKKIIAHNLTEFPLKIDYLSLRYPDNVAYVNSLHISPVYYFEEDSTGSGTSKIVYVDGEFKIAYSFDPDLTKWSEDYSVEFYYVYFCKAVEKVNEAASLKVRMHDPEGGLKHGFQIEFPVDAPYIPLADTIDDHLFMIQRFHSEAVEQALKVRKQNVVALDLEVPEEIKAAYAQYLMYFSQFLKDFGVDANAEIRTEANNILFTVIPENSDEALDKIRVALEVYLRLSMDSVNHYADNSTEIEVHKLTANIQHLKSQLSLAEAQKQLKESIIEAKDATIQALSYTINQQNHLLNGDMSDNIKNITPRLSQDEKDKEELIDGIVSLTKYEGQGFEVNIAEVFRRLKKYFKS